MLCAHEPRQAALADTCKLLSLLPSPPRASLLAGIRVAAPDSRYILCLDDDVLPHPGLLAALVQDMEADASLFMATGEACLHIGDHSLLGI
jgi:hypothetical protein